jgi:deazaflavin-dependent oxidoreductase (nitroreductase family)
VSFSDRLARINRRGPNQVIRSFAGRVAPMAVVEHRGRRSGRRYHTPVLAFRLDDGYVIALFYGAERDWVRNVLAAGGCTLQRAGRQVEATRPERLSVGAGAALVPAPVRLALPMLRVTALLRLRDAA